MAYVAFKILYSVCPFFGFRVGLEIHIVNVKNTLISTRTYLKYISFFKETFAEKES